MSVSVTFSEDMNANSLNSASFSVRDISGNPVAGTLAYANRTATFRPLGTLLNSHPYTVTLSSAITDSAGNAFGGYVWSFTTIPQTTTGGYYRACWQAVNDPRVSGYYLYWSSTTPIDIGTATRRDVRTPTTVELLQTDIGTTGATVYMAVGAYSADPSINSPLSNEVTVVVGQ